MKSGLLSFGKEISILLNCCLLYTDSNIYIFGLDLELNSSI